MCSDEFRNYIHVQLHVCAVLSNNKNYLFSLVAPLFFISCPQALHKIDYHKKKKITFKVPRVVILTTFNFMQCRSIHMNKKNFILLGTFVG